MAFDRHPLLARAEAQHGLLTRTDLDDLGATRHRRAHLLGEGAIERIGVRTYRVGGSPATPDQRAMAATLDTGGWLSHPSGAWLHGIPRFELGDPPVVTVEGRASGYAGPLAKVHSSTDLGSDDQIRVRGIPVLTVARTLLSLGSAVGEIGEQALRGAVDDAVRLGKASDKWLWWRLESLRAPGRDGIRALERVLVHRSGGRATESWLEVAFLELLAAHGIELPRCQRRIARRGAFVARVDFIYDDLAVVIEVLGHTHHASAEQLAADAARRNGLQMAGFVVLEFVYDDLVFRPRHVVASVRAARRMRPPTLAG